MNGTSIRPLRFHWSLSSVGEWLRRTNAPALVTGVPDLDGHVEFCQRAERHGIESVLMAFSFGRPDPFAWSAAIGQRTERMKFLVAIRSGITSPTYTVQQINTLAGLTDGRVCVNIVNGRSPAEQLAYGDGLDHDERYARTDEFWQVCHALWNADGPVTFTGRYYQIDDGRITAPFVSPDRDRPEIYNGGASSQAVDLARRHADCLLTFPDDPDRLAPLVSPLVERGIDVGLTVGIIAGHTRAEALASAGGLVESAGEHARGVHAEIHRGLDSVGLRSVYDRSTDDWLSPYLWAGAVPYLGPPAMSLVGSVDDIVDAIFEYREIGVHQFLFTGYPDHEQLVLFGEHVLPAVRERELSS